MRRMDDDEWGVPEDDWFAEPPAPRREPSESSSARVEAPAPEHAPAPTADELRRRRLVALAGVGAAIVLVAGGILVARAIGGDDDEPPETVVAPPPPPATVTTPPPPSPTPTPTPPSAPIVLPEGVRLSAGSEGDDVVTVQQALAQLGYEVGEADGIYGPTTEAAVIAFQGAQGLTADGIVGAETLAALQTALNAG
jgi:hypothetical protein